MWPVAAAAAAAAETVGQQKTNLRPTSHVCWVRVDLPARRGEWLLHTADYVLWGRWVARSHGRISSCRTPAVHSSVQVIS